MEAISFNEMLSQLAKPSSTPFRITYVVGQGKEIGQLRHYVLWPGAPKAQGHKTAPPSPGGRDARKTHLSSGTRPFTEFGSGKLKTLFIYNIIEFNGRKVLS